MMVVMVMLMRVQQEPEDLVLYSGSSLKVSCSITGTSNPDLFWYRWNETAGFVLVFTSRGAGLMDPTSHGRFKSIRSTDLQMVLECDGWNETAGFTLVFTSAYTGKVDPPSYGQFKSHRRKDLQIILGSDGVSEIESAVWYCAARAHSAPASQDLSGKKHDCVLCLISESSGMRIMIQQEAKKKPSVLSVQSVRDVVLLFVPVM
ncbi:T cell receptor beta [Clarias magur]|nr:T cell receptor beta [Clarias magur]